MENFQKTLGFGRVTGL